MNQFTKKVDGITGELKASKIETTMRYKSMKSKLAEVLKLLTRGNHQPLQQESLREDDAEASHRKFQIHSYSEHYRNNCSVANQGVSSIMGIG